LGPTNDIDSVLPKEFDPSDEELERYNAILSTKLDKRAIRGDVSTWGLEDSLELNLALRLRALLSSIDPIEVYTDSFLESLLSVLGVGNPFRSTAQYSIKTPLEVNLGKVSYETTPDFTVYVPHVSKWLTAAPFETRLGPTQPGDAAVCNVIAQIFSEMLGGAIQNYRIIKGDQEMFGVGLRQQHFIFLHVYLSEDYITALKIAIWIQKYLRTSALCSSRTQHHCMG